MPVKDLPTASIVDRFGFLSAGARRERGPAMPMYMPWLSGIFYALLLIALLWFRSYYFNIPGLPGIGLFPAAAYVMLVVGVPVAATRPGVAQAVLSQMRRSPEIWIVFGLYSFWRLLTSFIAPSVWNEQPFANIMRTYPQFIAYFLGSAIFLLDRRVLLNTPRFIVLAIFGIAFFAFLEQITQTRIVVLFGLDRVVAGNQAVMQSFLSNYFRGGVLRAEANFSQPLVFGQFMGAIAPLCLAVAFADAKRWRVPGILAFLLCLYCVFISTSRSGLLVLMTSMLVYLVLSFANRFKYKRLILIASAFALATCAVTAYQIGDVIAEVIGHEQDNVSSAQERVVMVQKASDQAALSPVFGHGEGTARWLAGIISEDGSSATIDSFYLTALLSTGYVGLLLWIALMALILVAAGENAIEGPTKLGRAVNSAITAYVAGMLVGFSVLSIEDNMIMVLIFAGYVMVDRLRLPRSALSRLIWPENGARLAGR